MKITNILKLNLSPDFINMVQLAIKENKDYNLGLTEEEITSGFEEALECDIPLSKYWHERKRILEELQASALYFVIAPS